MVPAIEGEYCLISELQPGDRFQYPFDHSERGGTEWYVLTIIGSDNKVLIGNILGWKDSIGNFIQYADDVFGNYTIILDLRYDDIEIKITRLYSDEPVYIGEW